METTTETAEARVLQMLDQDQVTLDEVAAALRTAWATAQGLLMRLEGARRVRSTRKGRVNVYFLGEPRRMAPPVPGWARVRDPKELAEDLEPYFARTEGSSETIRRERKKA